MGATNVPNQQNTRWGQQNTRIDQTPQKPMGPSSGAMVQSALASPTGGRIDDIMRQVNREQAYSPTPAGPPGFDRGGQQAQGGPGGNPFTNLGQQQQGGYNPWGGQQGHWAMQGPPQQFGPQGMMNQMQGYLQGQGGGLQGLMQMLQGGQQGGAGLGGMYGSYGLGGYGGQPSIGQGFQQAAGNYGSPQYAGQMQQQMLMAALSQLFGGGLAQPRQTGFMR